MKTFKTRLFIALWGMLMPLLTANCSEKKTVEKAETAATTEETKSVIDLSAPPFKKFVVVTTEDAGLYKEADKNSPNLVRWIESDCESDFCMMIYQWSNERAKPGFEISTDLINYEGRIYPVLAEDGDYYKVQTLNTWCDIESAYILKSDVGNIESAPIKADMLESEDMYFKCRVMKEGKYKDIVFIDNFNELEGETLQVGVLKDGIVYSPLIYYIVCNLNNDIKEDLVVTNTENGVEIIFSKNLAMESEEDYDSYRLDLNKLSDEQMAKIVDTVTKLNPEMVNCMYHFPAEGLMEFYYKSK